MTTPTVYLADTNGTLFTVTEICERCGVQTEIVVEMVEYGIVTPINVQTSNEHWQFSMDALQRLRRAQRLRQDLEINLAGLALSLDLLDEIESLRQEVQSLQHQIQKLHGL